MKNQNNENQYNQKQNDKSKDIDLHSADNLGETGIMRILNSESEINN